ncbi:hypothetical protein BN8_p06889 (plasmid) [Fibrisoma limi BUZ 3]|uniref:Uncharacterized protein n=1 Tax=Fibrisoma limi BUZ 3 TaxID=1185876 RepID=I2GU78_9BACT|nr:hypothetical protein BN8_p06889 [Fibrisoma limi BUZ 3]
MACSGCEAGRRGNCKSRWPWHCRIECVNAQAKAVTDAFVVHPSNQGLKQCSASIVKAGSDELGETDRSLSQWANLPVGCFHLPACNLR